jgi:hypothetical protein
MSWIEQPRVVPDVKIAGEGPEGGSLEARASLVFKAMGVIGFAGIALSLLPDAIPASALLTVAFNLAAGLVSVLYLLLARAIDHGQPWAIGAARPVLILLGAWSAYTAISGFTAGIVRIPFELAMVVWAFRAPPDRLLKPRFSGRSLALAAGVVPLLAIMSFGYLVFGWGGVLDVDPPDLAAALAVDCGAQGAGAPDDINLTYHWSWNATSPLPNEVDTVFIGWSGDDAEGHPLYVLGEIAPTDATIRSGQRGQLGLPLIEEARGQAPAGFQWAVDLGRHGYQPGEVGLELMRAREAPSPSTLTISASYIHLGIWREETQAVTCTW